VLGTLALGRLERDRSGGDPSGPALAVGCGGQLQQIRAEIQHTTRTLVRRSTLIATAGYRGARAARETNRALLDEAVAIHNDEV
jgi:hypothetical protein